MSKERARRRAEREAAAALQAQRRAARERRRAPVRRLRAAVLHRISSLTPRQRRADSALRRVRARQDGALAAGLVAANTALWLLTPSWLLRGGALVLTVAAWPLLVVLLFDRRSTR